MHHNRMAYTLPKILLYAVQLPGTENLLNNFPVWHGQCNQQVIRSLKEGIALHRSIQVERLLRTHDFKELQNILCRRDHNQSSKAPSFFALPDVVEQYEIILDDGSKSQVSHARLRFVKNFLQQWRSGAYALFNNLRWQWLTRTPTRWSTISARCGTHAHHSLQILLSSLTSR